MQAVKDITRRRGSLTPQLARKGSITDKYKLGRVLGIGSFSIVKEAVNKLTGEKVLSTAFASNLRTITYNAFSSSLLPSTLIPVDASCC
jgi:hypothetical protein